MNTTRNTRLAIALVAVTAVLLAATPALAATARAQGAVVAIDLAKSQVTLRQANGKALVVGVRPGTTLLRNAQPVRLPRLTLFDTADVTFRSNDRVATRFDSSGPRLQPVAGPLQSLRIGAGTIRVGGRDLRLDAASKISRNGQAASLSEISPSDQVVAHTSPGDDRARDLLASGRRLDEIHGTLQTVSAAAIVILPANGTSALTLGLDARTAIELEHRSVPVSALRPGQRVEAHFDPKTRVATAVEAESDGEQEDAHVTGTVAGVNPSTGSLTITPAGGGSAITLRVVASTEIEVDGEHGKLADVQVGMPVRAEFDLASLEASEVNAGRDDAGEDENEDAHFEGTISALDPGTITLSAKSGAGSVTLKITAATRIEVDDEAGTIADLHVGDEAKAEFLVATLVAKEIEVEDESGDDHGGDD